MEASRGGVWVKRVCGTTLLATATLMAIASPALAGDAATFMYGSDSNNPTATGSAPIYQEPFITGGGTYGGYMGEVWTWTNWQGCGTTRPAVNTTDITDANANRNYKVGNTYPLGTSMYWYMAGPGAMPGYNATNPSASAAVTWGKQQAIAAISHYNSHGLAGVKTSVHEPVLTMDIETTRTTTRSNGWNQEVNSCGHITGRTSIPAAIDRDTYNGFWAYVDGPTTPYYPAVYSFPSNWSYTFGTGTASKIPNSFEWTSDTHSIYADPPPTLGWSRPNTPPGGAESAAWFGGVNTSHKIAWQWAITTTGRQDWDQLYPSHWPGYP